MKINEGLTFRSFLVFLAAASSINLILYSLFYKFSDVIWSDNIPVSIWEIVPYMRGYVSPEGKECYALYVLAFAGIALTLALFYIMERLKWPGVIVGTAAIPVLLYYYSSGMGFHPPVTEVASGPALATSLVAVSMVAAVSLVIRKIRGWMLTAFFAVVLLPICFVAYAPLSMIDYGCILGPALRIIHGFRLSDIYFQYDLLMSLLAVFWIKLGLDFNLFQVAGQLSCYLFVMGAFLFSKRLFINKKLPIYLFIALVILRLFANFDDPSRILQVTPLRLDLWLILLAVVYFKGAYHWAAGLVLGLFLVFTRTLGVIYLASYLELLFVLFAVDVVKLTAGKGHVMTAMKTACRAHLGLVYKNLIVVACFALLSGIIFKGFVGDSAALYAQLGISFLRISRTSFYWYVPAVFSLVVGLLLRYRDSLPPDYLQAGLLLVFLAVGSSMYFFGRSHEHNIINLAGVLVMTLFLLFDVAGRTAAPTAAGTWLRRAAVSVLPIVFILLSTYLYSGRVVKKAEVKYSNLTEQRFLYPLVHPVDVEAVKRLTGGSPDVYILSELDCWYYYYGNYVPQGRFIPFHTWVFKSDLIALLQDLLDRHYYLVLDEESNFPPNEKTELLDGLGYNSMVEQDGFLVVWKR